MIALRQRVANSGFGTKKLAASISAKFQVKIHSIDVRNFIARRYSKVSKSKRKLIHSFFIDQGWLPRPIPRPRHKCPECESIHVIKHGRQTNHQTTSPQSLSSEKNSAGGSQ